MSTVTIQIGNGDDKLTQIQWHEFVVALKRLVDRHAKKLHFFGGPENWHAQQNVAMIFDVDASAIAALKNEVAELRKRFQQESAAWTVGETEFI